MCAYFENWGSSMAWRWFSRMWPVSWWRWKCSERDMLFYFARTIAFVSCGIISTPFFKDFSRARPYLLQQGNNRIHNFLFQLNTISSWTSDESWLAETSQQPISQITWLKVVSHCNHYLKGCDSKLMYLKASTCFLCSVKGKPSYPSQCQVLEWWIGWGDTAKLGLLALVGREGGGGELHRDDQEQKLLQIEMGQYLQLALSGKNHILMR